jgi:hypothetical protein
MPSPAAPILLFTLLGHTLAILFNRTIDDEKGDKAFGIYPVYDPPDKWTQGATCTGCGAQPDKHKAFDGTWHDSTYHVGDPPQSVTLTFNGELRCL